MGFYSNTDAAIWLSENLLAFKKIDSKTLEVHLKGNFCLVAKLLFNNKVDEMEVRDFVTGIQPNFFLCCAVKNLYEARKHTVI